MPKCRKCDENIEFVKTPKGKFMPTNPDGSPHWGTCPGAAAITEEYKQKRSPHPDADIIEASQPDSPLYTG